MIINQWGQVIIERDRIRIEGWRFQLEPSDPVKSPLNPEGPTPEQMLLVYATDWALKQLKMELQKAAFDSFRQMRAKN